MKKKRIIIAGIPMSLLKLIFPILIWAFLLFIVLKNKELIAEFCLGLLSIAVIRALLFDIVIAHIKDDIIFIGNPINPFAKRLKAPISSITDFDYHITSGSHGLHFLSIVQSLDGNIIYTQWVKKDILMRWEVEMINNYTTIPVTYRNDNFL